MKSGLALTALLLAATSITGCGLTQKIGDGTVEVTKSIFYKQVKTLHLDVQAREGTNLNDKGIALSTVVRVYQLKDRKTFDITDYPSMFNDDNNELHADLLIQKDLRIRPGESYSLDMPMEKETKYVAVAAMFHTPDLEKNNWRVVIPKDELDPDKARQIELIDQQIHLIPLKKD
ncbi:type VI secretion system lipoprotein TssJ [Xenorhabdus szentirmaii]|uniref:Type VI secretion system lipoprotein TssJ n=1 Tax=Xenorhabdus szentirmaii TaxID=290112 RepID=A0AAW3Z2D3_9GAMM|nr:MULTISPECIES: type VI secretion system lipoprotein TssJ [unclassified Xenorhabdus]MBD2781772.1 type VI secretion system lipoprotein TssJ [Xenorhabdus sp. 38]MBD2792979.1 type VI secretion system lipoprotein TssJ [Xenorhabdus sp. CUL]MBD2802543.1 type VI secretion system lipoprotein TssJ [Xenorhabdus sp. M]MBD2826420.1 type VI secretion system lipoprotein TssJ [Xenorhabdus sp. 5]